MNTVTVDLDRNDLLRAVFQIVRRARLFKLLFAVLLAYNLYLVFSSRTESGMLYFVVAFFVAAVFTAAAFVVTFAISAVRTLMRARRRQGVLGQHEFTIDNDGLREVTPVNETRIAWGYAHSVFRSRKIVIVRVKGIGFYLIPRRFFADEVADSQFWNALQPLAAQKEK